MNINKEIRVMFCSNYKDKIIEKESYNEFISSFSKEKIENIYKVVSVMEDDNRILSHVLSLSLHPKKVLIEDFTHNVKEMYKALISNSKEDILIQINMLLKEHSSSNIIEFELSSLKYSLNFIDFLNRFAIAKVKYLKRQEIIQVYIPVELKNTLKELLKDKTIEDKCKKNTKFHHEISNIVATYGVIKIKDLSEIYNKIYGKENEKSIFNSVIINRATDDGIRIVNLDTDHLVYATAFEDDEDAVSFYYSLSEKDKYKLYTKEEYEEIGEGIYHTKLFM